ncbi:beta-glucosidase BoGH3B-like isoform X4 [Carya illinoinensis]|uniref:beta-glucosidase BoGH3B-like isoform X4 n=1 Tax=Carya illinoinensis TaxID=32201 RepID=UPI001C71C27A|nr:beta-glucosidase BoGH3B-like isoform X4 [Carya illinoinensis]
MSQAEVLDYCVYKDPNAAVDARIKDLLPRMTLKEKVGQMTMIERRVGTHDAIKDLSIGGMVSTGGSGPFGKVKTESSDWADMVDRFQKSALDSRLGIPLIYGIDAIHGNNSIYGATIFPHNVGLGATRDADLAQKIGEATALEVRASGIHYTFAPCVAGVVISDWRGLDRLSEPRGSNYRYCISSAINAGIDMVMVPYRYKLFVEDLTSLVESGEVQMARIDDAIERILRVKFAASVFEFPFANRSLLDTVGCKLHRDLAREAVRKSLVLLKNGKDLKNPFLPLDRNAKRILVAGTHANDLGYQCGGWTADWKGSSGNIAIGTTILDAIKEAVGDETEVVYEQYPSTETLARRDFSYAVVAVGEEPYAETLGDNSELVIPFDGVDLLSSVAGCFPTLAILISGRPLVLEPWLLEKIDALIAAWLPGSEGGGIADVVFGDHDFEGKLPVTWFKRVEQLPLHAEMNAYDPLFSLGFGLTCNKEKSPN